MGYFDPTFKNGYNSARFKYQLFKKLMKIAVPL